MSDLFSIYEDSLNIVLKNISTVTETLNNLSKEKTESALEDAYKNVQEAERIVFIICKKLLVEANGIRSFNRKKSEKPASWNYRSEVESVKKRYMKIQENYVNKKSLEALMIDDIQDGSNRKNQKQRLIDNEEIAWQQQYNLEKGKRAAIQSEKISFDIMLNLDKQGNQMRGIRENVLFMNNTVDHSNSLLNSMLKREHRNKIFVLIFSVLLAITFIIIICVKLR